VNATRARGPLEDVRMQIRVDYDLCEANGVCVKTAPNVFVVDETDKLHLLVQAPPDDELERVKAAVRRCPRRALSLIEG
jgi:ferredoxin